MNVSTVVMLVLLVVVGGYAIAIYNGLVTLKHNVVKAWANIDVLLKQRHDELPKLVEVCKQYMQHEQQTLQEVTSARAAVFGANQRHDVAAVGAGEASLRKSLGQLYAVAESYPELRADKQFTQLRERISALENSIADRREYYNESVTLNNIRLETFPDLILARWFGFRAHATLEFSAAETADLDVKSLFG
ncbi:MAG: LemA family protein [Proteobacteria bacterium]|nr:LemA family protein [Pseudomonadota bacterium]